MQFRKLGNICLDWAYPLTLKANTDVCHGIFPLNFAAIIFHLSFIHCPILIADIRDDAGGILDAPGSTLCTDTP